MCGNKFRRGIYRLGDSTIACPHCGALLEHKLRCGPVIVIASIVIALIFPYEAGYTGLKFGIVAVVTALLAIFILVGVSYHISPPKVQPSSKLGDTGLRLGDKGKRVGR